MSIRIALDSQPEFYTNLDFVSGRIVLALNRAEQVGAIIVKLEGESKTALGLPANNGLDDYNHGPTMPGGGPGGVMSENHKILYKVQQLFPDEDMASTAGSTVSFVLHAGQHEYPFKFKLPFNNACSDPVAMSKIGGIGGVGGFGVGGGIFGIGGVRVMDGSKQLFLQHVTKTLPPSFTGFPRQAEIRYYIKVTIQRPGFLKENWRYQTGFKFMPIEPPRPKPNSQEAFARRPFTFRPRPAAGLQRKRSSLFSTSKEEPPKKDEAVPPSVEMSARLPYPSILTCNQPVPLRLIAKKLIPSHEQVFLTAMQIDLIGSTHVRSHDLYNKETSRWVVVTQTGLSIPLIKSPETDEVGTELVVPNELWRHAPLPNTVSPSFVACNLSRTYELEIKLSLSWGKPAARGFLSGKDAASQPQVITLPLHFSKIQVYSGIAPPAQLLDAVNLQQNDPSTADIQIPPRLPPRTAVSAPVMPTQNQPRPQAAPVVPVQPYDPLYPPQLGAPGAPAYDDAPPSYSEAMAETTAGPFDGVTQRPRYSGVTNENAPSQIPEKG